MKREKTRLSEQFQIPTTKCGQKQHRYPNTWRLIWPCFVQTPLLLDTQTHDGSFVHALYKHLYHSIPKHMTAHLSMFCANTSITRYPNTWRLICPCFVQTTLLLDTQTHEGSFVHAVYKHLYYSIPKHMTAHLSMLCTNTSITRYPNTWRLICPCFVQTPL
jgi:ribulose 1,5-bisphosphate synthetase/thiazole synthase